MEHESRSPHHQQSMPEMNLVAEERIERALDRIDRTNPLVDTETARVIASTLHAGRGTVLEHFAATGRLNPLQALEEIATALLSNDPRASWAMALSYYLEQIVDPQPDARPASYREPQPEVYLERGDGFAGGWVQLIEEQESLTGELTMFDWRSADESVERLPLETIAVTVKNAVGFHGLDVRGNTDLASLERLGRDVARFGEAFVAYVRALGVQRPNASQFRRRFIGSFDSMSDFLASLAETYGLLDPAIRGNERVRGPTVKLRDLEEDLDEFYAWHQGRTQVHVFARTPSVAKHNNYLTTDET